MLPTTLEQGSQSLPQHPIMTIVKQFGSSDICQSSNSSSTVAAPGNNIKLLLESKAKLLFIHHIM